VSSYAKERAKDRIATLAVRGLDAVTFFREVTDALVPALPMSDTPCWTTLDPASLLITSCFHEGDLQTPHEWCVWEYLEDEVLKSADVVRSERGISTLLEATGGDPSASRVYREYLRPRGLEHEVVVALRARTGEAWGTLDLVRELGQPEFDAADLAFLRTVAPYLAEGVRRGLLVGEASDPGGPEAPGLVVFGEDWSIESLTPGVEDWLEALPGGDGLRHDEPPTAVLAVAARALRTAEGQHAPGEVAIARVLTRDGRWVVLHGAALVADGRRRAAVIVEPAQTARITPLLMAAYGLTEREQDVTRLVLKGDSTAKIAEALSVSPHTVQQHLKSVFVKTGVRSRRELVGKVYFAHYEPRVRDNEHRVIAQKPIRGGPLGQ
jgi:DNA-binding CsgD family transcriptional regulator